MQFALVLKQGLQVHGDGRKFLASINKQPTQRSGYIVPCRNCCIHQQLDTAYTFLTSFTAGGGVGHGARQQTGKGGCCLGQSAHRCRRADHEGGPL